MKSFSKWSNGRFYAYAIDEQTFFLLANSKKIQFWKFSWYVELSFITIATRICTQYGNFFAGHIKIEFSSIFLFIHQEIDGKFHFSLVLCPITCSGMWKYVFCGKSFQIVMCGKFQMSKFMFERLNSSLNAAIPSNF